MGKTFPFIFLKTNVIPDEDTCDISDTLSVDAQTSDLIPAPRVSFSSYSAAFDKLNIDTNISHSVISPNTAMLLAVEQIISPFYQQAVGQKQQPSAETGFYSKLFKSGYAELYQQQAKTATTEPIANAKIEKPDSSEQHYGLLNFAGEFEKIFCSDDTHPNDDFIVNSNQRNNGGQPR